LAVLAPFGSSGHIEIETGAAALVSVAAAGVVPAVMVEARFPRRDSSWGVGVGALAVGSHTTAVGSGQGQWRRLGGMVDLRSNAKWRIAEVEMR
jgi:hypothetical protein